MVRPANFARAALTNEAQDQPALIYRNEIVSHAALRTRVETWASGLIAAGLQPQQRVVLLADNSPFALAAYLAVMRAGGVAVPLSPAASVNQVQQILRATDASVGFVQRKYVKRWLDPQLSSRLEQVWIDDANNLADRHNGWLDAAELSRTAVVGDWPDIDEDTDLAAIMFTSGSTGIPRGVMVSHGNLRANTESIVRYLRLTRQDRAMLVLPLYYCYGASVLHTHLWTGGSVMMSNNFMFPEKVLKELDQTECTGFYGVPSTYQILIRRTSLLDRQYPKLRYWAQAGGRLANTFIEELTDAFPDPDFYVMYGQTEATARLSYLPPERLADKRGSIGRGIPGVALRVLNADGDDVRPGEVGEIVASGPNVTLGYWRAPEASAQQYRDGNLWTGDMATLDEEGFIYIRDRKRDFLKVAGMRVSSKEIEDTILEMSEVVEVAVIGVPDQTLGEAVVAYVVPKPNIDLTDSKVIAHCCAQLANEKVPSHVIFREVLPKNEAGKILKTKLKAEAGEESPDGNSANEQSEGAEPS